jgi:hypothetical protein
MAGMSQVGRWWRAEDVASGWWRGGKIALEDVLQVGITVKDRGVLHEGYVDVNGSGVSLYARQFWRQSTSIDFGYAGELRWTRPQPVLRGYGRAACWATSYQLCIFTGRVKCYSPLAIGRPEQDFEGDYPTLHPVSLHLPALAFSDKGLILQT